MAEKQKDILSFYKSVIRAIASHGLALGISMIGSIMLTRALGADGRGIVSWVMALSAIGILLAQAGMGHTNRRFSTARHHRAPTLFTLTLIICGIISFITMILLGISGLNDSIGADNKSTLFLALLSIPISAIGIATGEMLIGLKKDKEYSTLNLIEKIINTVLLVIFILIGIISPFMAVLALVIAAIFRLSVVSYYLRNNIKLKLKGAKYVLTHIGSFTFFNYVASTSMFFATNLSIIFTGSLGSKTQAGLFAANMIIINALRQLGSTTGLFAMPKIAKAKDYSAKTKLKLSIIIINFALTLAAAVVFTLAAQWLIPLIFGSDFTNAVEGFKMLLIGLIFASMMFVFQSFIAAESKNYVVTIAPLILVIFTAISGTFLIPEDGANGASYSWTISHAAACFISGIIALILHRKSRA